MYELFVVEEFEKGGRTNKRFHRVGVAFDAKNGEGFDLVIPAGISVTGKVFARPPRSVEGGDATESPY